jgi:uracil-DNA glycosylase
MGMSERKRLEYLAAMGIQTWTPRVLSTGPDPADPAVGTSEPIPAEVGPRAGLPESMGAEGCRSRAGENLPASTWESLQREVEACTACPLHGARTQTVFGVGDREAGWMVIGEAPGEQEDLQGEPFVGRAGLLLNEMLRAIGLKREQVYIANILKCRPPKNRDPQADEAAACETYLRRQLALLRPKVILAVGRIAAQNLLKSTTPIGKLRGVVHDYQGTPLVVTYHPAYLLRSPLEKRRAWDDLRLAQTTYRQNS